jgi:hypothetical protein
VQHLGAGERGHHRLIKAYAERIARDYDGGLDERFDQFLYKDRYAEPALCAWLSAASG